jgi:hypothetical protein
MARYVDVHLTLQAEGVEISVRVTEADLDQITAAQRRALTLVRFLSDPDLPFGPETGPVESAGPPTGTDPDVTPESGAESDTASSDDPHGHQAAPAAEGAPQTRVAGPWPHPKRPARPRGKGPQSTSSARERVMAMLVDGPVEGTLEELSSEADCTYGALRQVLTKAVAAGTIHRSTAGRVLTLSIPGDTRPAISIGAAA